MENSKLVTWRAITPVKPLGTPHDIVERRWGVREGEVDDEFGGAAVAGTGVGPAGGNLLRGHFEGNPKFGLICSLAGKMVVFATVVCFLR
jgi:hypothetical protein